MNSKLRLLSLTTLLLTISLSAYGQNTVQASEENATLIVFDAPGAGTGQYQGTFAVSINSSGTVTGYVVNSSGHARMFVRTPDGNITTYNVLGAASTEAAGINDAGSIAGTYFLNGPPSGYVRNPTGQWALFNYPGAAFTIPTSINAAGVIAGTYNDSHGLRHGFVRANDGTMTQFIPSSCGNPNVYSINAGGAVSGDCQDGHSVQHCYLRAVDGTFIIIDPQGSIDTYACSVNVAGFVTGPYVLSRASRGFVRNPTGTYSVFDAPEAGDNYGQGTYPVAMNRWGTVAGYSIDSSGIGHGFARSSAGSLNIFTVFDAPGSGNQGTFPQSINDSGTVTGSYVDANGAYHGFVRTRN